MSEDVVDKHSPNPQGHLEPAHCASVLPSGQREAAQGPPTRTPAQGVSAGQKETPDSRRSPTCMSRAWADDSEGAGSAPGPVTSFLGEPVSVLGPGLLLLTISISGGWAWAGRCCSQSLGGLGWRLMPPQAGPQRCLCPLHAPEAVRGTPWVCAWFHHAWCVRRR